MKTRFLLHGGRVKLSDERNDRFFRELVKDLADGDQVLSIGFAQRDETVRQKYFERDKGFLLAQTKADINVINATYDDFIEQIGASKSVYITGGDCPELVKNIQRYQDFDSLLRGKVIGGTSAGACLFAAYYLNLPEPEVMSGLSVFPIRLMVHYGNSEFNSTDKTLQVLQHAHPELELLRLRECERHPHGASSVVVT